MFQPFPLYADSARSKHLSLGKRGCPENPVMSRHYPARMKNTYPSALENRPLMPSLKQRATQSKTNRGMTTSQHHVFSSTLQNKAPSALAAFKLNFSFLSKQKVAAAKNLISQDRRTEGTHINPNKE